MKCFPTRLACLVTSLLLLYSTAFGETLPFGIRHGDRNEARIAITMDDCAFVDIVEKAFNFCEEQQVCITFFPIGKCIKKKDADLWRRIAESPYAEIGSHTMKHGCWEELQTATVRGQIADFNTHLDEILGYHYEVRAIRPPHGHYDNTSNGSQRALKKVLAENGFEHVVLWDVSQTEPGKALRSVKKGSILLFHSYHQDLNCIERIVPKLKERGMEMVTVSQLLGFVESEAVQSSEPEEQAQPTLIPGLVPVVTASPEGETV